MSEATKRKYVRKEAEDLSVPTGSQTIVRMVGTRGNNLHEVENPAGEKFLVSMPKKFRLNIWVRHGHFVVIEPILEGGKVKAEIVKILKKEHIKWYKQQKCWPREFDDVEKDEIKNQNTNKSEDEDADLFVNTNRCPFNRYVSDSLSDSDSD